MPFTASHPAIILPLTRLPARYYSLTGLVVGSVSPDFEYFIRLSAFGQYGHTWWGVLWFDLPLGLLLCFLFHAIVRNPLYKNAPAQIQPRLLPFTSFNWTAHFIKNWPVVILSIIIGTVSHIMWDAFTHYDGIFVRDIRLVRGFIPFAGKNWPMFFVLQHVSTLIGGAALLYAFLKIIPAEETDVKVDFRYWKWTVAAFLLFFSFRVLPTLNYEAFTGEAGSGWSLDWTMGLGDFVVSIIGCGLLATLVISFLWSKRRIVS